MKDNEGAKLVVGTKILNALITSSLRIDSIPLLIQGQLVSCSRRMNCNVNTNLVQSGTANDIDDICV